MSLISLVIILALLCVLYWAVRQYVPESPLKPIIFAVIVIIGLLVVLSAFGVLHTLQQIQVPQVH